MKKYRKTDRMDEEALFNARRQRAENSLQSLKDAGSIKEAGVVFSHEGMALFAQIFENTMRRVVREELESNGKDMMQGILEGMMEQAFPKQLPEPKKEENNEEEEKEIAPETQQDAKQEMKQNVETEAKKDKPKQKRKPWTQEEDDYILNSVKSLTERGVKVTKALNMLKMRDRASTAITTRYYTLIKQK
jgi:hypothetical protein